MTDVLSEEPLALTPDGGAGTRRFFHMRDVEWRDSGNGQEEYTFTGYPVLFNTWSELLWTPRGSFRERFLAGSFQDVLATQPDVRLLKNHNKDLVLARTKSGTLEITEEEEALRNWARIAKTSYATDLKISMDRGDIDQMSVAFELDYDLGAEDLWYEDKKSGEVRHDILKVSDVFDQSIVTFPAYAETSAIMRDLQRAQDMGRFENYTINTIAPKHLLQARGKYARRDVGLGASTTASTTERISPRMHQRCREAMAGTAWAMHPSYVELFYDILDERAGGERPTKDELKERVGIKRDNEPVVEQGGIAVIPLMGPIMPRAGAMSEMSGARSLHDFRSDFRAAVNEPDVTAIVLQIDSPGGVVSGVPEMAAEIRKARGTKPIIAVADYFAASAAYWIATAADELVVSPSAEVGSVGVYAAHRDHSERLASEGVKTTYIHAGENKVELAPEFPLSDEARAHVQEQVDQTYEMFVSDVAKSRRTTKKDVIANFGGGRMAMAPQAVAAGMADRVATLDEVLAGLTPKGTKRSQESEDVNVTIHLDGEQIAEAIFDNHIDGPDEDYYAELYTPTILEGSTEALPPHNTSVENKVWDAASATQRAKGVRALRQLHAWVDGAADPSEAPSYKFPHHSVDEEGNVGPAVISAVMKSLDVLANSKIPNEDKEAVRRHLLRHKEAWDDGIEVRINEAFDEVGLPAEARGFFSGTIVLDETHYVSQNDAQQFGEWYVTSSSEPESDVEVRDFLGLVAQAERDPAGHNAQVAQAETDPVGGADGVAASAETDPADGVTVPVWKQQIKNRMQRAREDGIRLTKEMLQ